MFEHFAGLALSQHTFSFEINHPWKYFFLTFRFQLPDLVLLESSFCSGPAHNLKSSSVQWNCAVVIKTKPQPHNHSYIFLLWMMFIICTLVLFESCFCSKFLSNITQVIFWSTFPQSDFISKLLELYFFMPKNAVANHLENKSNCINEQIKLQIKLLV